MIHLFRILFFFIFLSHPQKDPRFNKQGNPSTYGLDDYVKRNELGLIKEYEYRIDTLYDVYIGSEDLGEDGVLGEFYLPNDILITNQEKFVGYEFKDLSKFKQRSLTYNERTVKAVIFHELTHAYFNQILMNMKNNNQYISPEYGTLRMFPNPSTRFGAEFIEEGVCEYTIYYLNESNPIKNIPVPDNEKVLLSEENKLNNLYCYSVIFLEGFLDKYGIHKGIEILISNKPPSYEEILHPKLFFNRIK